MSLTVWLRLTAELAGSLGSSRAGRLFWQERISSDPGHLFSVTDFILQPRGDVKDGVYPRPGLSLDTC